MENLTGAEIEYENICKILKRNSFEEKMRVCDKYSRPIIDAIGNFSLDHIKNNVYPWELETFLIMALAAVPEYDSKSFQGKDERRFFNIINSIKNHQPKIMEQHLDDKEYLEYYLTVTGLTQFNIQEIPMYKMYRYNYIFNYSNDKINVADIFDNMFETEYKEFLNFGQLMIGLYGIGETVQGKTLEYIAKDMFPKIIKKLSISVDDFNKEVNAFTETVDDYLTCVRPSYSYPFIIKDNYIYLPLPHVLSRAVTSSLLYRLTSGNDDLRTLVGKEVLEKYLFDILNDSNIYDEVHSEKTIYVEKHTELRTLDVMIKSGDNYIFLDSKASVPSNKLRTFDKIAHNVETKKMSEKIIQIYKHLRWKMPKYPDYTPFKKREIIEDENLWGICVVLEDSFVMREKAYQMAAVELGIEVDSKEYDWMIVHIKITQLYDIEYLTFNGFSLEKALKLQTEKGHPFDFGIANLVKGKREHENKKFKEFIEDVKENMLNMISELQSIGLIK